MAQPAHVNRTRAARIAQDTLAILHDGSYTSPSGRKVDLGDLIDRSITGTQSYPPRSSVPESVPGDRQTVIEVVNETTLAAGKRLSDAGHRVAALNFASAKNAGGGFLGGSRAQEESLARSSALYAAIRDNPMYAHHRRGSDAMYSNYAIYSPDVPVFKDDGGTLLEGPWLCSFITAPAVNAKVVLGRNPSRKQQIADEMWRRVLKVLGIAARHDHDTLVLGAWGCGVFGNDPVEIAGLFRRALEENFAGAFAQVVFAVTDSSADGRTIGPLEQAFARR
jgi:uncharacterized protein (TIGR02452 family)